MEKDLVNTKKNQWDDAWTTILKGIKVMTNIIEYHTLLSDSHTWFAQAHAIIQFSKWLQPRSQL